MPGVNTLNGGSGVIGTVIIYHGKLHENAKERLAACRRHDQPVFTINMDLFKRNRKTVNLYLINWSTNRQILKLSFCSQKRELCKKPSSKSFWLKAAIRDCQRGLAMVHEFSNVL